MRFRDKLDISRGVIEYVLLFFFFNINFYEAICKEQSLFFLNRVFVPFSQRDFNTLRCFDLPPSLSRPCSFFSSFSFSRVPFSAANDCTEIYLTFGISTERRKNRRAISSNNHFEYKPQTQVDYRLRRCIGPSEFNGFRDFYYNAIN